MPTKTHSAALTFLSALCSTCRETHAGPCWDVAIKRLDAFAQEVARETLTKAADMFPPATGITQHDVQTYLRNRAQAQRDNGVRLQARNATRSKA